MTRQEFVDEVWSWGELMDFCYDNNYELEDIFDEDAKDDYFDNEIEEMARNSSDWRELLDRLEEIPNGYDWYVIDDYYGFRGADEDDFRDFKDQVLEWADHDGIWDDDEEPDEEPMMDSEEDDESNNELEIEEPLSIRELFAATVAGYQKIETAKAEEREENEALFDKMFA